ncbi:hypothetical protein L204_104781 [Cryptococcus depauperatus]|nr:hypothetical protein L204_05280 [Cryptococcus depauperatus CBS 7855]
MDPETQLKNNPGYDPKHDSAGAKHPSLGQGQAGANPQTGKDFEYAPQGAHSRLDSKDERSLDNVAADAERVLGLEKRAQEQHEEALKHPTAIAQAHGNEPSKGAKTDEELVNDDEEELEKKKQAKLQSKEAHKSKHL